MRKPFFYFKRMTGREIGTTIAYFLTSALLGYCFFHVDKEVKRNILLAYGIITLLGIYPILYVQLRNMITYLIWVAVAFIHIAIYFYLKDDNALLNVRGHAASILLGTFPLLIVFQFLRWFSLKAQSRELVCPDTEWINEDMFDERKPTKVDWICFVIFYSSYITLSGVLLNF